ncbi:MAG: pyrroloquinoline quinone biosynthesis protein PqqE, partial [Clostridia bacterium]|nr:pyrroloquinoline quinone biosynthesis protein PqqE [Clostridia bacterium]
MNTMQKAERAMVGKAVDLLLEHINKDRQNNLMTLVDLAEKITGDRFSAEAFAGARELVSDENGKWMQYAYRILDEVDPHVIRTTALNLGYQAAYAGTKEIRENRKKHQCNVPWLLLIDPTSACNMHCKGCWAAEYGHKLNLTFDEL